MHKYCLCKLGFIVKKLYLIIIKLLLFRLIQMGALDVSRVVNDNDGWRLITCMWLHGGVLHLLANMLSLLVIGIRLEQEFGFGKYLRRVHSDNLDYT